MYNQPVIARKKKDSIDFYNNDNKTYMNPSKPTGYFKRKRIRNKNTMNEKIIIQNPVIVNVNNNCIQTFNHVPKTEHNTTHNSLENLFRESKH